jgi:hypothetical protein
MNDFSELERRLRSLRPIAPSEDFVTRIERALADATDRGLSQTAEPGQRWKWLQRFTQAPYKIGLGFATAAAAAAFLIYARVELNRPPEKAPSVAAMATAPARRTPVALAEFVPAALTEVVYNKRDEGLRFPAGPDQPMRRIRYQKRETIQWRNPATGASLRVSYPTEEISLARAPGQ